MRLPLHEPKLIHPSPRQHRSKVQVVDARTFDQRQILDVPCSSSSASSPPPRPRPPPVRSPRAFVDSLYAERISPVERYRRNFLQDVGHWTGERYRPGDESWGYVGRLGRGGQEAGGEEEDEIEDDEDESARQAEEEQTTARRTTEDDCPPDGSTPAPTSSTSTLGVGDYSRILPDPRARLAARDTRTFYPRVDDFGAGDLPPFHLSSSSTQPIGARILSGYSPLAAYGIPDGREWRSEGLGPAYQATSLYFPVESTPSDLLGLDWNEEGTSLFVATENRVTEWEVDTRARRSFGEWGMR